VPTLPNTDIRTLVTLAEAASYLGVSKPTLRNWDKEGKLVARRHPLNKYRVYDLADLRALRTQGVLLPEVDEPVAAVSSTVVSDSRSAKRIIAKLHNIIRNTDADSSILGRFDELTKLLFLKLTAEKDESPLFRPLAKETNAAYAARIRSAYTEHARNYPEIIKGKFARLESSDKAIYECGEVLASVSFQGSNFDLKGVTYEEVIRNTFDKGDHQQFFTPHQIITFMVKMMEPHLKGVVADPACGTAGFLAEVLRSGISSSKLIGLEIDERLAWVSGINLLLHGAKKFETLCLTQGGTLGPQAERLFGKVDAILTNPPFGSDFNDAEALKNFTLGRGRTARRRGILFIEQCHNLLRDKGVLAIIIDEGVLNLPTASDVRRFILDRFDILSIVSLPDTAFMPYANVSASILFLRKSSAPKKSQQVFYAHAENIGRKPNGDDDVIYGPNGESQPNSDFAKILEQWHLASNGTPVEVTEQTFVTNVAANLTGDESMRFDFRYHHPSRFESHELLSKSRYPLVSIADLCDERNESMIPSQETEDHLILYTGLANIESGNGVAHQVPTPAASLKSAVKRYEPNDIVFARMRPSLRKISLMNFREGGYVSPECSVFVVRNNENGTPMIDPEMLATLLRSDLVFGQILHLVAGIGRPRLNVTDLRTVRVPLPPKAVQDACKREYQGSIAACRQLRTKAQTLMTEAQQLEVQAVNRLANSIAVTKP
jgi:excisionase family DNA binding protein